MGSAGWAGSGRPGDGHPGGRRGGSQQVHQDEHQPGEQGHRRHPPVAPQEGRERRLPDAEAAGDRQGEEAHHPAHGGRHGDRRVVELGAQGPGHRHVDAGDHEPEGDLARHEAGGLGPGRRLQGHAPRRSPRPAPQPLQDRAGDPGMEQGEGDRRQGRHRHDHRHPGGREIGPGPAEEERRQVEQGEGAGRGVGGGHGEQGPEVGRRSGDPRPARPLPPPDDRPDAPRHVLAELADEVAPEGEGEGEAGVRSGQPADDRSPDRSDAGHPQEGEQEGDRQPAGVRVAPQAGQRVPLPERQPDDEGEAGEADRRARQAGHGPAPAALLHGEASRTRATTRKFSSASARTAGRPAAIRSRIAGASARSSR